MGYNLASGFFVSIWIMILKEPFTSNYQFQYFELLLSDKRTNQLNIRM